MTRKEWMEKNLPAYIDSNAGGGVIGCPRTYRELARIDPSVLISCKNKGITCTKCWNMDLNVKEERKETMTRKEWVKQHYPGNVKDSFVGGILGCPYKYPELCKLDPNIKEDMICPGISRGEKSERAECDTCWNTPLPGEGIQPSDQVETPKTMGEPHIGDTFYAIVPVALGNYQLYIVGEFVVNLMSSINDRQVKCSAFDDGLAYQYNFFYDLVDKTIGFNYEVQRQAKNTPNLDRSLFLERRDAIEALEKWTGNVADKSYYFLKQKGE